MAAERKPPSHASLLGSPLALLTGLVLKAPLAVIAGAIVLAVGCILLAVGGMGFRTSRLDLLNPGSGFNQRWLAYLDEFGDQDDVVVVVDGPTQAAVVVALEELAESVRQDDLFYSLMHEVDLSPLRSKALHYLSPDDLRKVDSFVEEFDSVAKDDWSQLTLIRLLAGSQSANLGVSDEGRIEELVAMLAHDAVSPSPASRLGELKELEAEFSNRHILFNDGRRGLLLLRIATRRSDTKAGQRAVELLREHVARAQQRHPEVGFGVTGMPILEHDEMLSSQQDTAKASVLSLAGVACVFVAGFGGLRRPLLAVAALLAGIAWSFGYITLAVGHLNILSVAFGVILIGLGIDFGIHYLARYLQLREGNVDTNEALINTASSVGPGIVTGGLTTALAFSTAALTEFTGVAELGVVAGGGILLCIAAALLVLPALLAVFDGREGAPIPPSTLPFAAICRPTSRLPGVVLCLMLAVTGGLAYGITKLRYDHNLLNLQPRNQESVEVERKLAATSDRSVWFAVSMCRDRDELKARQAALEASPAVTATEEIVSLLPESSAQHQQAIQRINERLATLPEQPPVLPVLPQAELLQRLSQRPIETGPEADDSMRDVLQRLSRLSPQAYFERVSRLQQGNAASVLESLRSLHSMSNPLPPTTDDLPGPLVHRYVGRHGQHLLRIYGRSDIWNMNSLRDFVAAIEAVDPLATGHPIQTFYASTQMQESYIHAAVYSLLAVAIVLMLDFRNIGHSLLAMLPMALGLVQLLGLLGWLDIPLNPANMIVLPLILGIGIDDGVHVVHDFLRQEEGYQISESTATGVFLTSATTMIGFGSMMIASHAGLRSLGQVLTLGVFCCLASSVLVLPVILGRVRRS